MNRDEVVGRPTGNSVVTVERGPLSIFAKAVTDQSEVYQRTKAAQAAGLRDIPVPPTYFFSAGTFWGAFPDDQPTTTSTGNPAAGQNPITEIVAELMANGGLILHGEQEFEYHQPICAGAKLTSEGKVVDFYTKQSGERTMTFVVTENQYRDDAGELVLTSRMNLIHRS